MQFPTYQYSFPVADTPPMKKAKTDSDISNALYDTTYYSVYMTEIQKAEAQKVLDDFRSNGGLGPQGTFDVIFEKTKDYQRQFILLPLLDQLKMFGYLRLVSSFPLPQ